MNWMIDLKKSATMQSGEHRDENVKRKLEDMEHRMREKPQLSYKLRHSRRRETREY